MASGIRRILGGGLVVAVALGGVAAAGLWVLVHRAPDRRPLQVAGTIEASQVDIAPKVTGRILAIAAEEGQAVRRGTVLVVLDAGELEAEVARLEAAVTQARAQLRDLRAGARREELAAARAELARAEAHLADLQAGARREELDVARQALAQAEARLRDLLAGARPEEVEQARQTVAQAEARLRDLLAGARPEEVEQARSELRAAEATRVTAEREHERLQRLYDAGLVAAQERDRTWEAWQVARERERAARERLALLLAGPRPDQVEMARAEVAQARERVRLLLAGPRPDQVEAARAEVRAARDRLRLLEAGPRPDQVEMARAEVQAARDRLALLEAGPRPHQLEAARARVAEAEAALQQARARLTETRLEAPLDGVVLRRNLEPGATALPGTPVLTLIDPGRLWLRAYVPEAELGRLRPGQRARVTVDAFPDRPFPGYLAEIAAQAEFTPRNVQTQKERAHLVFRVKLVVEDPEGRLKPGIPADAVILTD